MAAPALNQTIFYSGTNTDLTGITPASTPAATIADNTDIPERYGTLVSDFDFSAAVTDGGVKLATNFTAVSARSGEFGAWFLNPKFDRNDAELLTTPDDSLCLRLYSSGGNWADYYQTQHREIGSTTLWKGGWLKLRASGGAGSEDRNSGTWTNTDADNIVNMGVVVSTGLRNDQGNNGDAPFAVDLFHYYDKIELTGYNGGTTDWLPEDIIEEFNKTPAANQGFLGVFFQKQTFFWSYAGFDFGESPAAAGGFSIRNKIIFLSHSSEAFDMDCEVFDDFKLEIGQENVQTDDTYAQDGGQLIASEVAFKPVTPVSPVKCAPAFKVAAGGLFDCYASLIQGFGSVNLGDSSTTGTDIDMRRSDFYDNGPVEIRTSQAAANNCRFHTDSTDKGDLVELYYTVTFNGNQLFNGVDALYDDVGQDIISCTFGDNTVDVSHKNLITTDMISCSYSITDLKQV